MAPATKTTSVVGAKRKTGPSKESHTKSSKKPKIGSVQNKPAVSKSKAIDKLKIQTPTCSSDDEFDGFDNDDGGVNLDAELASDEPEAPVPTIEQGVHPDRVKANSNSIGPNGTSSRESHAKQKQLIAERKASKPLAEQIARSKKIWERLRRKSHVPLEERKTLIEELFTLITGKIKDYALKHDSVRVVQTATKYANLEQRKLIAQELQGSYRQLAESKYAKFLIGKLLVQGDAEIRDMIVPEFYGSVRRSIKHPEAAWILDDVYRGVATRQQKATILREWYGAEFAIFPKEKNAKISGDLADILAQDTGKRAPIMRSLYELINHLIQKKTSGFTLLHDAMLQYFLGCKPGTNEITDFIELIRGDDEGDLLKNLAFTKSGSRVVSLALAYGTAKDRKHILKTYKDTLQLMASDTNAHVIILTAYEVIDDTVLTAKSIFSELLGRDSEKQIENVILFTNNIVARTTLLYLFQGRSNALFPPSLSSDLVILSEIDGIRKTTSKKDPETRRRELVKALSPYLLPATAKLADQLATSSFGCQFIVEVLFGADGDKSAALKAIASTAAGNPNSLQPAVEGIDTHDNTSHTPQLHIAQNPHSGKMLKTLVAGGRYSPNLKKVVPVSPALNFADILYPFLKGHVIAWAIGGGSFVIAALLESPNFSSREKLLAILKENKHVLETAAREETAEQKAIREREKDEAKGTEGVEVLKANKKIKSKMKKREKGEDGERPVGNMGTKWVLRMLDA